MTGLPAQDTPGSEPLAAPAPPIESRYLSVAQAQAFLRLVESAPEVHRRSQFFVWMQNHVHELLPHDLAVCGAFSRQRRLVEYDVFNNVPMPSELLDSLSGPGSRLMAHVARAWVEGGGRACAWVLGSRGAAAIDGQALRDAGLTHVAVHGVARPDRQHEIESLFMLGARSGTPLATLLPAFELLVLHLHATFLHTRSVERDIAREPTHVRGSVVERKLERVTAREAQILSWVREGKSNHEIGEILGISGLTVKNHIQKILRKLGASNRAQAVAIAIQSCLMPSPGGVGKLPAAPGATPAK
jgi:transcriptional regulator EpsA